MINRMDEICHIGADILLEQTFVFRNGLADLSSLSVNPGQGIKAIAIGSFTKAGEVFRTDVKVLDVDTKGLLNSANIKGTGIDSILDTQIDSP